MNIIVCVKQIRHTYTRTGRSPETQFINPEDGIFRVDPHDESALELALQMQSVHTGTRISLLTLGSLIAADEVRRGLAAGADQWWHIPLDESPLSGTDPFAQPDPWIKADLLAQAVRELNGDLVLCGNASIDRGSGLVGALVAHHLQRPFVSAITGLHLEAAEGVIHVQRSAGRGVRETIECRLPAVFSVAIGPDLRLPTVPRRQWAQAYAPGKLAVKADGAAPKTITLRRVQPRPRPKPAPGPDSRQHAYKRIMQLLTGSTIEKKGEMLIGSPGSQVDGIITFLEAHGFLGSKNAAP